MTNELRRWIMLCEIGIPDCHGPCLYHATYRRYLPSIMKNGLGNASTKNFRVSRSGVVYMSNDPDVALNYAQESQITNGHQSEEIVILAIDQRQLNPFLLHKDENDLGDFGYRETEDSDDEYDNSYISYEYHGVIPPTALSEYDSV